MPSAVLTREQKQAFERDGYVVVPSVFSAPDCEAINEVMWALMPPSFERARPETWAGRLQDCCNNLPLFQRRGLVRFKDKHGFSKHPVLSPLIHQREAVHAMFAEIVGRACKRVHVRGLHPNLPMPRHISINEWLGNRLFSQLEAPEKPLFKIPTPPQVPIVGHLDAHKFELGMMIYTSDVGENGGGLDVWPGSHRLLRQSFNAPYEFLPTPAYKPLLNHLQEFEPRQVVGNTGDVLIFHNRLMHANSLNTSESIRFAVLIDLHSDFVEQNEEHETSDGAKAPARRAVKRLSDIADVKGVTDTYKISRMRRFWRRHRRLRQLVGAISQDPIGRARRNLSSKIRSRKVGDVWLVVSQGQEHQHTNKLDAYGLISGGTYVCEFNGQVADKSDHGVVVARLKTHNGENIIKIRGKFKIPHYVRVVQTGNPLSKSQVLFNGVIEKGSEGLDGAFSLSTSEAVLPVLA